MSLSEDLRAFLLADATIASLIGARIYPIVLPQGPTVPALTYHWVSIDEIYTMAGPSGLVVKRIQFDCWAETFKEVEALSDAIRLRIDGFSGWLNTGSPPSSRIQAIFREVERDWYEDEPVLYRRTIDYFIHAEEVTV
jgi:hypothetical protein